MTNVWVRGAILSGVLLALCAGPASAHAELIGSDPKDGSSLGVAPDSVRMTFSEPIGEPAFVALTAPDGKPVSVSQIVVTDRLVTAAVADVSKRGRFALSYRVVSVDGHPVEGTVHYTVRSGLSVAHPASAAPHRDRSLVPWGVLGVLIGGMLVVLKLRRRDDPDGA